MQQLGFAELHVTTHSLRRGGATHLLMLGADLGSIMLRGRWASERSAREYLRRGQLAVLRTNFNTPLWEQVRAFARAWRWGVWENGLLEQASR
eukprot:6717226-Lingulodinium_polyedra.AAC.1